VGNLVPFGDYDLIAYLMVGLAMFMVLDLVFGLGLLYRTKWNSGSVTGIVILAYLGGHLTSIPSAWIFEDWLVGSCFSRPVEHLVPYPHAVRNATLACSLASWLKPDEYDAVAPQDVLTRIAAKVHQPPDDRAFFHEAFATAKRDANSYERMQTFQRLYLLFRNMAFLALCGLVAVSIKRTLIGFGRLQDDRHLIHYGVAPWMISFWGQFTVFLVLGAGLLDRFLFFYRLYALEVITAYAYAPPG
jgi:hypothetical protein